MNPVKRREAPSPTAVQGIVVSNWADKTVGRTNTSVNALGYARGQAVTMSNVAPYRTLGLDEGPEGYTLDCMSSLGNATIFRGGYQLPQFSNWSPIDYLSIFLDAPDATAEVRLNKLITFDAERVWDLANFVVRDETKETAALEDEMELFVARHGADGIKALSTLILARSPSGEAAWALISLLPYCGNVDTLDARRSALAAMLECRDAGLRYAAAGALGSIRDNQAFDQLRRRLSWERNPSVHRIIASELRA